MDNRDKIIQHLKRLQEFIKDIIPSDYPGYEELESIREGNEKFIAELSLLREPKDGTEDSQKTE